MEIKLDMWVIQDAATLSKDAMMNNLEFCLLQAGASTSSAFPAENGGPSSSTASQVFACLMLPQFNIRDG